MAIEVVPAELYALAGVLDGAAVEATRVAAAADGDPVGGSLGPAVAGLCETARTAGRCLAGELGWLSEAVTAAADSWLGLDERLLPVLGRGVPQ